MSNMKVLGVVGLARAGKDTFSSIAIDILKENGIKAKQYSFAGALNVEVKDFLQKTCGVNVYTQDTETKKDIRDFLVWYGTTFWRKRDPKRWIRVVDHQIKDDGNDVDIAIVSDVRYPNEGEWVHSWNGYLVHVAAFHFEQFLGQESPPIKRVFLDAPNEQERINDPIVKQMSDYKLEWPIKGLGPQEAVSDAELRMEVRKALNACSWFADALTR